MTRERHDLDSRTLVSTVTALDNGDQLAVCVDPTGQTHYWLLRPLCAEHEAEAVHGRGDAAHEQLGPLPEIYRLRLAQPAALCGRPCRSGRPCRNPTSGSATSCHHHRRPVSINLDAGP